MGKLKEYIKLVPLIAALCIVVALFSLPVIISVRRVEHGDQLVTMYNAWI